MDESSVEVEKNKGRGIWYCANVVDVLPKGRDAQGGDIQVAFDKDIWARANIPPERVRRAPHGPAAPFSPVAGELVEVAVAATGKSPAGWTTARVKLVKGEFYFICYEYEPPAGQKEIIVEKEQLRRVNDTPGFKPGELIRDSFPIEDGLSKWIVSSDALGCFAQVLSKGGLVHVGVDQRANGGAAVVLLGSAASIRRGKILLEVHLKHQREIQRFHDRRQKTVQVLEERRAKYADACVEEFNVDEEVVGLVIGKGGENLRRVEEKHKVEITVEKTENATSDKRRVKIVGDSKDAVQAAREEVEYVRDYFEVDKIQFEVVFGRNRRTLEEIREKSGAIRLRYETERGHVDVQGLRSSVEDALLLLEGHTQYFSVYQEMNREQEALDSQVSEFSRGYGYGRGYGDKGEEKGKEKGGFRREVAAEEEPAANGKGKTGKTSW